MEPCNQPQLGVAMAKISEEPYDTNPTALNPPFLRIPGELRNKIYKFFFEDCSPGLMYFAARSAGLRWSNTNNRPVPVFSYTAPNFTCKEFNQLKYVNKKLYAETKALELQFCKLRFDCYTTGSPWTQFQGFVTQCSASKGSWITSVYLSGPVLRQITSGTDFALEPIKVFLNIAEWCRKNSKVNVEYAFPDFRKPNLETPFRDRWLVRLYFLKMALRNENLGGIIPTEATALSLWLGRTVSIRAKEWQEGNDVSMLKVANLKFVATGGLDEVEEGNLEKYREWWRVLFHVNPRLAEYGIDVHLNHGL